MKYYLEKNLKYLRNKYGIEQTELAKKLNLKSNSTISEWENGKRLPSIEQFNSLSKIFNVPMDALIKEDLFFTNTTIGDKLKKYRKSKNISLEELTESTNLSKETLSNYENGTIKNIPIYHIEKLAKIYGVSPTYLNAWQGEKEYKIPVLKTSSLKKSLFASENILDYFIIDEKFKADFAFYMEDDSMNYASIYTQDLIFIKTQNLLTNGELGAFLIDDNIKLRRITKQGKTIELQLEGPNNLNTIETYNKNNITILGKLVGIYRPNK